MPLAPTDLPPLNEGDWIWFAMTDDGKPVDCYVEREILDRLKRGSFDHPLDRFAAYRPVFEVMIISMYLKGMDPVVAVDNVTLFLQGTRDALADMTMLVPIVESLNDVATLKQIEGADHAFHVLARSGTTDAQVLVDMLDALASWVAGLIFRG